MLRLSSPVININSPQEDEPNGRLLKEQVSSSSDTSSLSAFSSSDSSASTPNDDIKKPISKVVSDIKKKFESNSENTQQTRPKSPRTYDSTSIKIVKSNVNARERIQIFENVAKKSAEADPSRNDPNQSFGKKLSNSSPQNNIKKINNSNENNRNNLGYKVKDRTFENTKLENKKLMENKSTLHKTGTNRKNTLKTKLSKDQLENINEKEIMAFRSTKDDIADKFQTYVRTVRLSADTENAGCDGKHLFTCCLLVGLMGNDPYIKMKFPKNIELPKKIEDLCFPDVIGGPLAESITAQCYSLLITTESGDRLYGYCRRVIPEGSRHCVPLVYCILSKRRAPMFYRKILEVIETRHGIPDKIRNMMLTEFYEKSFPNPGHSVTFNMSKINFCTDNVLEFKKPDVSVCDSSVVRRIKKQNSKDVDKRASDDNDLDLNSFLVVGLNGEYGTLNRKIASWETSGSESLNAYGQLKKSSSTPSVNNLGDSSIISLRLHEDIRYEDTDLEQLYTTIKLNVLKKIFASLLLERSVILVSCVLSRLSSCIEALQSILYPFAWPHTLVPVLPQTLWEIVESPTPLICGCLSPKVFNNHVVENGIVVDLDTGDILKEVGDEDKILPHCLIKSLEKGLSLAQHVPRTENAFNVMLSDAFLRIFIESCGHYREFITNERFNKAAFLEYPQSRGVKRFLKWFTETTMFHLFIDSATKDPSSFPIFDKRIQIYSSPELDVILQKMKAWKT